MSLFYATLTEGSSIHKAALADRWLEVTVVPGKESEFNALARRIMERNELAAFPSLDAQGNYASVLVMRLEDQRRG